MVLQIKQFVIFLTTFALNIKVFVISIDIVKICTVARLTNY